MMTIWKLAVASLWHFWRTNLALLSGVAIGTAVLSGALLVGDSVRGSLRSLTVERLGRISEVLLGEEFFGVELAETLQADGYREVLPAILLNQVTVQRGSAAAPARSQGVTLLGITPEFWQLRTRGPQPEALGADEIILNQALADELGASLGDKLLVRVAKPSGLAADSPLARKDDLVETIVDLTLVEILPTAGLGRFSLQASQQLPMNGFVTMETLQSGLDRPGQANAILVASQDPYQSPAVAEFRALQASLTPTLQDLGLALERVSLEYRDDDEIQVVLEYDTLTNDRMIFTPDQDRSLQPALRPFGSQPVFTFIASKIQKVEANGELSSQIVPYSTITAVDSVPQLGPLMEGDKVIISDDDGIVLNQWAAEDLDAHVGDLIRVTYFEPETTHGLPRESSADFRLQFIAGIREPVRPFSRRRDAVFEQPPTLANDPHLTPEVEGITDAETINRWDAPFPMDRSLLRGRDDEYWSNYRTTPKAFISLAKGRALWQSRFGGTTSYRLPVTAGSSVESRRTAIAAELATSHEAFGLRWIRAKQDGLAASRGTTPFDALFFGFSMFIIASALMLVSLLLRLNLEHRASQAGLLGALGFPWKRSLRLFLTENALLALAGSVVGVLWGVAYAWLMLAGLRTLWVDAVVVPFLQLEITAGSLLVGLLLGITASLLTIVATLLRLRKVAVSQLMAGKTDAAAGSSATPKPVSGWIRYAPAALVAAAIGLGLIAPGLPPEPQGGAFFGAGTCVLTALLLIVTAWLRRGATDWGVAGRSSTSLDLRSLALRNLTRSPTRSALTVGLVAAACFLIIAISAFRLAPTEEGTGGYELVGRSDQPIFSLPADMPQIVPLRLQAGDDASCRNLYQSSRPQLIGLTDQFIEETDAIGNMEWSDVAAHAPESSPWSVLQDRESEAIPVVLDKNTAMYGMQIFGGVGTEFERDYGTAGVLKFRLVGLLSGSIFQGSMLIHEERLLQHFPRVAGYRYFLVDAATDAATLAAQLEDRYSDEGLDLVDSERLLAELLAVQNTYLSTFQSLGGLGLLLGTFGLAAVQLRNILQRRGELALLRATGFGNNQLSLLLFYEHAMLLLGGLGVGTVAAAVVIFPHMLSGGASVPVISLGVTLGLIITTGIASALVTQRYLQQTPLLPALRGD